MTSRSCTAAAALVATLALGAESAGAAETWVVEGGRTTVHLDARRLRDLGLEVEAVRETAERPPADVMPMEAPYMSFAVASGTVLELRADHGIVLDGSTRGGLRHEGGFVLREMSSGAAGDFMGFRVDQSSDGRLYLSDASGETSFELSHGLLRLDTGARTLTTNHLELTISAEWARTAGRPDLAGAVIGLVYLEGRARHTEGTSAGTPGVLQANGGFRDVKLGILDDIRQSGREGDYPDGINGLSMATTSCNVGDVDVPWLAPMAEDHPSIGMQLYREVDGTFEQIGTSWLKHGFYALSNSQCTPCQNPSGGEFLGVGCSDTYGSGNNENRRWLGPRSEWDPYAGTWKCSGSFFSGYEPDCTRREDGSGYNGYEHRLEVDDVELGDTGATYYYEAYYIARDDDNKFNNWGSRRCTMSWNDGSWSFDTPISDNPLVEGPALYRWGDMHTVTSAGPNDGDFLVAVKVTDLGEDVWLYDYNVLNMDSDREIHTFTVPLDAASGSGGAAALVSKPEFFDWDSDAGNDWTVDIDGSEIVWSTEDFDTDPGANALVFGYMFTFRFEANTGPLDSNVAMTMFKPGPDGDVLIANMMAPGILVSTGEAAASPSPAHLLAARPNPVMRSTSIPFVVESASHVDVTVFDAAGRRVKKLVDRLVSVGAHDVAWDRTSDSGEHVAPGVYFVKLANGGKVVGSRSIVVVE